MLGGHGDIACYIADHYSRREGSGGVGGSYTERPIFLVDQLCARHIGIPNVLARRYTSWARPHNSGPNSVGICYIPGAKLFLVSHPNKSTKKIKSEDREICLGYGVSTLSICRAF